MCTLSDAYELQLLKKVVASTIQTMAVTWRLIFFFGLIISVRFSLLWVQSNEK